MKTEIKLDAFTQAYIECALWSSTDDDGDPLDGIHDSSDISDETFAEMCSDCKDFQESFAVLLEKSGLNDEQAGHDFWLTRNRHGAGFWDRGLGEIGRELTEMSHPYGEYNLYIGDDGQIHAG